MEELSSSKLTLDEVDNVIQSEAMWKDFKKMVDQRGKELPASKCEMNTCTITVAALLTFWSWQQPGAVANATLAEYNKLADIHQEGETVTIIMVANHKMGLFRSAKLIIPPDGLSNSIRMSQ